MRFLTDENVPRAVTELLRSEGFDVALSTDLVPMGSPDPIVATAAMTDGRILVSHDRDMRSIDRYISAPQIARYPTLGRVQLCCAEEQSAQRVAEFLTILVTEFDYNESKGSSMKVEIGRSRLRICR